MNEYTIQKPRLSPAAWALGVAAAIGLIGLGAVAFAVFVKVDPWWVALAFALTIEIGAAFEALSILRGNRWAIAAAVISVVVSGSYNLQRVENAGMGIDGFAAWALAFGPLASVLFLALSLSHEIARHEKAVKQWEVDRQVWEDARQAKANQEREEREERTRQEQREREERQRSERLEAQRIEGERLERVRLAEIKAQERQERREARSRERQEQAVIVPGPFPGTRANVPPAVPPTKGTYREFAAFMDANGANHSRREMAERFNVTERAITKWRAKYESEHPQPDMVKMVN